MTTISPSPNGASNALSKDRWRIAMFRRTLSAVREPLDAGRLDRRNAELIEAILPLAQAANRHYLRLRTEGFDNLPSGPVLYVANHNGGVTGPDLCCTMGTLWEKLGAEAPLYCLAHDFAMRQMTAFGAVLQQFGAMRAAPENARRALASGAQVLVYPGGDIDAYRHFSRRDEVVLGERTGFIRIAQEAGVPIVPIVAHGAHRSAYIFAEGKRIARYLGLKRWGRLERFPLALALPWGLAVGPWTPYLPLPFPIRLRALDPIEAPREADPAALREQVRAKMQHALSELAGQR